MSSIKPGPAKNTSGLAGRLLAWGDQWPGYASLLPSWLFSGKSRDSFSTAVMVVSLDR